MPDCDVMRRVVLRDDGVFLAMAGVFGLVSDLQSYVAGTGPFGQTFFQNSTVIGVVEAHGLAVLTAGTLWLRERWTIASSRPRLTYHPVHTY